MTLDDVAAQLYALPPEEFTAARGEAVAAARKAGDRELAGQIGALRRPTVGAWLVNLLAHQRPDLIGELLALGEAMRAAQRNLRGDELRELSTQRRTMVSALARESRALAVAAGRGVRAVLPLGEVENTLIAALADPDVADEVRLGRLVKPVEYAGFGEQPRPQLRLVHGGGAKEITRESSAPGKAPSSGGARGGVATIADKKARKAAEKEAAEKEAAERDEFERQAVEEHEAAKQRAAEQAAARQAAAEQRRRQQTAHRELLTARTALAEAEAKRAEAEKAVRDAKRRVEQAMAAVQAAAPE